MLGNQQKKKEEEAQQALVSQLQANETLLAFASGNISNSVTATPYHVGLTPERFFSAASAQQTR